MVSGLREDRGKDDKVGEVNWGWQRNLKGAKENCLHARRWNRRYFLCAIVFLCLFWTLSYINFVTVSYINYVTVVRDIKFRYKISKCDQENHNETSVVIANYKVDGPWLLSRTFSVQTKWLMKRFHCWTSKSDADEIKYR